MQSSETSFQKSQIQIGISVFVCVRAFKLGDDINEGLNPR